MTLVVGVDIGGTKTSAGLVDSSGTLLAVRTLPTPAAQGPAAVLDTAAGLVAEVASGAGGVTAVGVGSAGVVDPRRGVIVSATGAIAGWAGTDLRGEVSRRLGLPVTVGNDVHAHALGEQWRGAAAGYADVLLVAVGTGIGASVVLGGRVLRGAHSVAGHAGHVPAAAAAGRPCPCGGHGHVEAVASGPALLAEYRARAAAAVSGLADVARLAAQGDRIAVSVLAGGAAALGGDAALLGAARMALEVAG
ncbi:glucokinase [Streptosporangium canum]|uniref:Glucokinase n=1 Tax=Streptosporangium canum TaxID=324952 RepID=A0A1I4EHY3_9ACTN|nr:ROK family protein [Streptosporangium canum]SFL04026.1 glucokinase [Streptosporangium canum]